MSKLSLSLACCDYDRCRALFDGRVTIEGCEIYPAALEPEECFHRAFKHQEFDISELSLSSHTMTSSQGTNAYVGVPAFVSRLFRHAGIYIRTDRGIDRPEDLVGKRDTYALRVRGESMIDEQIRDGDLIVVESRKQARNGDTVVALVGGSEATLKRFYKKGDRVKLVPANAEMDPIEVDARDVEIRGVLRGLLWQY